MFGLLLSCAFTFASGLARLYTILKTQYNRCRYARLETHCPQTRYYLCNDEQVDFEETDKRVPEDCVYIEEWINSSGQKKCVILYEGEEIPTEWTRTPFDVAARCPWIWVGDKDTEIDLTRSFEKYLVVGNVITYDLVSQLIRLTDRSDLTYIDATTFEILKFPGDGITIKAYDEA
jgi:hypothetical protein